MVTLSEKIKAKALEVGFHKVGIAPAAELRPENERFAEWLSNGFQGEMAWLEREPDKRTDPQVLFRGSKSVVVVGLNYFTPHEHADEPAGGKISRYAWGDDYHDVVKEMLRELLSWIENEVPGVSGKACVDTAPIMDKAWAVRAGLGWMGKHSNVITKEYGSWIFIGELLLDVELDYDHETVPDHCGTCTACLDACPTQAIVAPYIVDSRLCLSYATIELRSPELPEAITQNMSGWIYGCDICQDVCPWNRFEKPTDEERFQPRNAETSLGLDETIEMTHETYVERFRRSAIKRAKLTGLQRNAAALKRSRG